MMPNSDLKVLGEKVRTERKLAGLTQEQLAERCHVSTKHTLTLAAGVIVAITFQQVDGTPNAEDSTQSDNQSLKNFEIGRAHV